MYISKKNKQNQKPNKTKKQKFKKRVKTFKSGKIFFDDFKSLKGKIPKYAGKVIPTKFTDIRGKMEYHSNYKIKEETRNLHKGQRKLMVMELDFINYCWPEIVKRGIEDKVVFVYVGAAPSNHTTLLADLFPKWKFILYDPRSMHPAVKKYKNIEERIQFFMDEDCDEFTKIADRVLFVSDIRDMTTSKNNNNGKREDLIFNDMKMQMDWVKKINPVASSLKFRLPYTPGTTNYLDGVLKLQCWSPKESAEGRLFVPHSKNGKYKMKKYDNTTHEQRAFYFNNKVRKSFFPHNSICYQHNYDSAREYIINREFVEKVLGYKKQNKSEEVIQNRIFKMMKDINYCVRIPGSVLPILSPHANKVKYNL